MRCRLSKASSRAVIRCSGSGSPVALRKVDFVEAELARLLRHDAGKGFLVAGHALGDGHAGVVARLHDDALQELLQRSPSC